VQEYLKDKGLRVPVFAVSAETGQGLEEMLLALRRQALPPQASAPGLALPFQKPATTPQQRRPSAAAASDRV
jgi:hypothetical protein